MPKKLSSLKVCRNERFLIFAASAKRNGQGKVIKVKQRDRGKDEK